MATPLATHPPLVTSQLVGACRALDRIIPCRAVLPTNQRVAPRLARQVRARVQRLVVQVVHRPDPPATPCCRAATSSQMRGTKSRAQATMVRGKGGMAEDR